MSNFVDRTEMIQSFMSITDVRSAETAEYWLEASNFSIDSAINLFFSSSNSIPARNEQPPASSSSHGNAAKYDMQDSSEDIMSVDDAYQGFDNFKADALEEVIRKPDTVKKQRLMDAHNEYFEFQAKKDAILKNQPVSTFGCATDRAVSKKELTLAKIFQVPHDLMTQGFLSYVREMCKSEGKWLLVNIQREEDFNCHVANRDIWSEENIKEIVLCGFLFWQVQNISVEGIEFCKNYKVSSFPHIAVIDPRTGAQIWSYTKKLSAEMFSENLMDFLGSHPYPDGSSCPSVRQSASASISAAEDRASALATQQSGAKNPPGTQGQGQGQVVDLTGSGKSDTGGTGPRGPASVPVSGGNALGASSGSGSGLSTGVSEGGQRMGFDPAKLPDISEVDALKNTETPCIKVLFKIPSVAGSGSKSYSLPLNASVLLLAAHAADMMSTLPALSARSFDLVMTWPMLVLSRAVSENPLVTLSDVGIKTDTAINIQLMQPL